MSAASWTGCVVLALIAGTGACRDAPDGGSAVGTTTITAVAVVRDPYRSFLEPDPRLTRRVEVALATDPGRSVAARNVTVSVDEGVATLEGSVAARGTQRELESVVAHVPGIRRVDDRLEVSTTRDRDGRESDDRIAFALQRSLTSLAAAGNAVEAISIDVESGRVTLRGRTDDGETRAAIAAMTERTPGVIGVVDAVTAPR